MPKLAQGLQEKGLPLCQMGLLAPEPARATPPGPSSQRRAPGGAAWPGGDSRWGQWVCRRNPVGRECPGPRCAEPQGTGAVTAPHAEWGQVPWGSPTAGTEPQALLLKVPSQSRQSLLSQAFGHRGALWGTLGFSGCVSPASSPRHSSGRWQRVPAQQEGHDGGSCPDTPAAPEPSELGTVTGSCPSSGVRVVSAQPLWVGQARGSGPHLSRAGSWGCSGWN